MKRSAAWRGAILGVGAASILLLLAGKASPSSYLIALAILLLLLGLEGRASRGSALLTLLLLLAFGLGEALGLGAYNLAGTTYDTYIHLLAAFTLTLLGAEALEGAVDHPAATAALAVLGLGLGVELVQWLDRLLAGAPFPVADSLKDLLNDGLGVLLALIGRGARRGR